MIIVTTGDAQCLNTFDFPTATNFYVSRDDGSLYVTAANVDQAVAVFHYANWIFAEKRDELRNTDET